MFRGKVTNVTSAGVFVQTADFGTVGPCQAVVANYAVGDMVLLSNVGDDSAPDLVVVGTVSATGSAASIPDGSITSAKIADGTIVNADISGSAAIDRAKISGTAITAADSGTVTSAMIADGTIVNDDINASAAIARSKISGLPTSSTDNTLPRFDSTAGALQTSGIVVDDNNRLRVASGSSGGLEIGSSGVLTLSYTGTPSGVSAPVGSTWRQTDANSTYGNLTGLLWNKVGTGTTLGTDWLVDFEGRWISYTPTWTATGGTPTVGNGTLAGRYTLASKLAHFNAYLLVGTTTSFGTTTAWEFALPATASSSAPAYLPFTGYGLDSGAAEAPLYPRLSGTTKVRPLTAAANYVEYNKPWSWVNGDSLTINGTYEIA